MLKMIHMKKRNLQATVVRLLPFIISLGLVFTMICYIYPYVRSLTLYGKPIVLYDATGNTKVIRQKIKTFSTLQTFHTSMPKTFELNQTDKQQKCTGCFSESIHLIIDNIEICKPSNKYIDILIMITSSPQNKWSRNAMRDTWLRHTKNNTGNIRYVFLLGESPRTKELEKENFQTKDIILGSFKDAYNNLTFKTLMGFQWANKRCPNAQFVMKTDDDVYVHIPGLKKAIKENANALQNAVGGRCQHIASPVRDKRSKWYVSFESYPEKTYPGYCSGTGYVTSLNVITKIVKISKSVPFFNLEDVFVALCIKKLGLRLNPITGFMLAYDFVNCKNNDNKLVTIHQVSVSILRRIWEIPCNANKV
ncbi:beta-1,3-galactosyltransferase 5-like [Mytilus galloprovincialis]|uniref:beta-1,3-galactosyltransferase 5-like n=1 Tax=Mytilus galloprovincialis TaxID=29158 RepID=UPI003F7C7CBD